MLFVLIDTDHVFLNGFVVCLYFSLLDSRCVLLHLTVSHLMQIEGIKLSVNGIDQIIYCDLIRTHFGQRIVGIGQIFIRIVLRSVGRNVRVTQFWLIAAGDLRIVMIGMQQIHPLSVCIRIFDSIIILRDKMIFVSKVIPA